MKYQKSLDEMSEEEQERARAPYVAVIMFAFLALGAWSMSLIPSQTIATAAATREAKKCTSCHSYLVTADQKFTAAYPGFKPIAPWSTADLPPLVLSSIPNKWYRLYAKGTFELGGRRYDAVVRVVPLLDGRVAVNTYDPSQRTIAILP